MSTQAKSRLSSSQIKKLANQRHQAKQVNKKVSGQSHSFSWANYLKFLPTFVLGSLSALGLTYILRKVYPADIANWGLYHSYLPLLLIFFSTVFFLTSFLMQKSRHGLLIAVFLTSMLFLKLQDVLITPMLAIIFGGGLLLTEAVFKLVFKR